MGEVPKLKHQTSLDNTILMTILLLVVTSIQNVVEHHMDVQWDPIYMFMGYMAGYTAFVLCQIVPPALRQRRIYGKYTSAEADEQVVQVEDVGRAFQVPKMSSGGSDCVQPFPCLLSLARNQMKKL